MVPNFWGGPEFSKEIRFGALSISRPGMGQSGAAGAATPLSGRSKVGYGIPMPRRTRKADKNEMKKRSNGLRLRAEKARRDKILTTQRLLASMKRAREDGEQMQSTKERNEESEAPRTPREIIVALRKYRRTLALMLMKLFHERQKHALGSFQVQSMGLLLSEIENLLNRLECVLPAESPD